MSSINSIEKIGGISDNTLELFQPFTLVVFLSLYSPIILASSIVGLSFVFQNFKGFIYLGFLIGCCLIRNWSYMLSGGVPFQNDRSICTIVKYSNYGNPTFSAFVFAFTITYLCIPMFSNGAANFWIFTGLLVYFFLDLFIKTYKKCVSKMGELFINILSGAAAAAVLVTLMYVGGSGNYLFFNEVSSNKDICYQPKQQTFKCQVFKDGTLVGNI